jgi:PhnB protein
MMFTLTDRTQTQNLFHKLSEAAHISTPLGDQPWGDYFGKLTDRFGVQWMFNCQSHLTMPVVRSSAT